LSFSEGLTLVSKRAMAMQKACEAQPSTMAAILMAEDELVEKVCSEIDDIVVPANYNCPGQLVISGSFTGIDLAIARFTALGKRAMKLNVGGAFHSPLMEPAKLELAEAINSAKFSLPVCPVYQNVSGLPESDPAKIRENLIAQLTSPVRWTQTIRNMINDGATIFIELGPGKVLQGLVKKVNKDMPAESGNVF
jgi:[acyl-carrier-protein] S-malonyltransferase